MRFLGWREDAGALYAAAEVQGRQVAPWVRFIVTPGIADEFVRRFVEAAGKRDSAAAFVTVTAGGDAAEVYERLGSPEGELALAQAVVYLAVAPKSNAVYKGWNAVRELVRQPGSVIIIPDLPAIFMSLAEAAQ
mgnify:CR=1 FL=1